METAPVSTATTEYCHLYHKVIEPWAAVRANRSASPMLGNRSVRERGSGGPISSKVLSNAGTVDGTDLGYAKVPRHRDGSWNLRLQQQGTSHSDASQLVLQSLQTLHLALPSVCALACQLISQPVPSWLPGLGHLMSEFPHTIIARILLHRIPVAVLSVEHRNLDFWPRIVPAAPKQHHHLGIWPALEADSVSRDLAEKLFIITKARQGKSCDLIVPIKSPALCPMLFAIYGYLEVVADFTPTTRTAGEENLSRQVFLVVDVLPTRLSTARVTGVATAKNFATEKLGADDR
ncbi:hypothetical protein Landi51_12624 [Colletotrichum acutatum]